MPPRKICITSPVIFPHWKIPDSIPVAQFHFRLRLADERLRKLRFRISYSRSDTGKLLRNETGDSLSMNALSWERESATRSHIVNRERPLSREARWKASRLHGADLRSVSGFETHRRHARVIS